MTKNVKTTEGAVLTEDVYMNRTTAFACPGDEADYSAESWYRLSEEGMPKAEQILGIAQKIRAVRNEHLLRMPPGITFEAEHLGAEVVHDTHGRRYAKESVLSCAELEDFFIPEEGIFNDIKRSLVISDTDMMFCVSGAFSVCLNLMGMREMSRAIRKHREQLHSVLRLINAWLCENCIFAIQSGAKVIYFSDAAGTPELFGTAGYRVFAADYQCDLIKRLLPVLDQAVLYLCGRTADALLRTGRIRIADLKAPDVEADRSEAYGTAREPVEKRLLRMAQNPEIRLLGMGCLSQRTPCNADTVQLALCYTDEIQGQKKHMG